MVLSPMRSTYNGPSWRWITSHHGPGGSPARSVKLRASLGGGCFWIASDGLNVGRLLALALPTSFMILFATPLPAPPPGATARPSSWILAPPPAPAGPASAYTRNEMPSSEIDPNSSSGPDCLRKRIPTPETLKPGTRSR